MKPRMTYEYKCKCGAELKVHTDDIPPKTIECYHCKRQASLKRRERLTHSEEGKEEEA
ncbi:MAG TPA: hypothetical protein P5136_02670 [Methanofastidiosum sp.]|nr:hypothetical protein [Methanofastidiosum sp.]